MWGLHFLATVAKSVILTITYGEGIQYRGSRCVERGLARYSPTEEFLIVVEGSAFYEERASEMVARGSSGALSGTRCVCETQTQGVSTGGRLCRRVPPRGRDYVSGRNGRAVSNRETARNCKYEADEERLSRREARCRVIFLAFFSISVRPAALPSSEASRIGAGRAFPSVD